MRIGKILIDSDHDTHEAKVVYAKFPEDIAKRKVLLMYPIMSKLKKIMYPGFVFHISINSTGTGNTVVKAVSVLKDHSVLEVIIIFFRFHFVLTKPYFYHRRILFLPTSFALLQLPKL